MFLMGRGIHDRRRDTAWHKGSANSARKINLLIGSSLCLAHQITLSVY